MNDRRAGALPVVLALIVGSASVFFGYVFPWTGSPAVDGLLTILGAGAFVFAITVFARRGSGTVAPAPPAGLEVLVDAALVWCAYYAAYRLWFGNGETLRVNFPSFLRSCPIVVASQMLALLLAGAYTRDGRRSGREMMFTLGAAVAAQQLLLQFSILAFWSGTRAYSRGAILIGAVGVFGLLVGWRTVVSCAAAAPSWWQRASARHRLGIALAAVCALTGVAWSVVVPPFEAPDEIYFCRIAVDVAEAGQSPPYDPMFFRLVEPMLHVTFNAGLTFDAVRNPAFRFVSNQAGRVTMFRQEPKVDIHCKNCGLSFEEFGKVGRLGCANCYQSLSKVLLPLIKRVQRSTTHMGKKPSKIPKDMKQTLDLRDSQERLKKYIQLEEFEEAAKVRDEIRKLEEKIEKEKNRKES